MLLLTIERCPGWEWHCMQPTRHLQAGKASHPQYILIEGCCGPSLPVRSATMALVALLDEAIAKINAILGAGASSSSSKNNADGGSSSTF
jgi:hypothetical protein